MGGFHFDTAQSDEVLVIDVALKPDRQLVAGLDKAGFKLQGFGIASTA